MEERPEKKSAAESRYENLTNSLKLIVDGVFWVNKSDQIIDPIVKEMKLKVVPDKSFNPSLKQIKGAFVKAIKEALPNMNDKEDIDSLYHLIFQLQNKYKIIRKERNFLRKSLEQYGNTDTYAEVVKMIQDKTRELKEKYQISEEEDPRIKKILSVQAERKPQVESREKEAGKSPKRSPRE